MLAIPSRPQQYCADSKGGGSPHICSCIVDIHRVREGLSVASAEKHLIASCRGCQIGTCFTQSSVAPSACGGVVDVHLRGAIARIVSVTPITECHVIDFNALRIVVWLSMLLVCVGREACDRPATKVFQKRVISHQNPHALYLEKKKRKKRERERKGSNTVVSWASS